MRLTSTPYLHPQSPLPKLYELGPEMLGGRDTLLSNPVDHKGKETEAQVGIELLLIRMMCGILIELSQILTASN
jgi:hypothetical protein